jgi:hypothetical protein
MFWDLAKGLVAPLRSPRILEPKETSGIAND